MELTAARFEMQTVRDGYAELCRVLVDEGRIVKPRGLTCFELTGVTLVVDDPTRDAMPVGIGRNLNPAIGAVEALQLVGGVTRPELLTKVAPNFKQFMDDDTGFYGAYGPRIGPYLPKIVQTLIDDPDSRQAVLTIWRPEDLGAVTKDLPCTLGFQFLLRDDGLELHTTMRSNDVWWGWAYDAFQFTQLQMAVAGALGVGCGPYVHRAGSFHLYERDLVAASSLTETCKAGAFRPALNAYCETIEETQALARAILDGETRVHDEAQWFVDVLAKHR